jgi:hypothetical protein
MLSIRSRGLTFSSALWISQPGGGSRDHMRETVKVPLRGIERFWNWFTEHESQLYNLEGDPEEMFDGLAAELQRIHPDLTFELGPRAAPREFVISAGGLKAAFPAVIGVVDAAPRLDRWKVIAFRPRRRPPNIVAFRGKSIDPNDVQFSLLNSGKTVGLYLFIPEFVDGDATLKQIGYLLLDDALGEYDVESRLGLIKMLPPSTKTEGDRFPLVELPTRFDCLVCRLEGHPPPG